MLRIGYKASAEQFTPRALLDFGVLAEETGFDSVFISDHFQPWRHTGGHAPHALVWMGALGAMTSRIIMGTSVLTPTFRHHPSMVAQSFGTLGSLYAGRVVLGIGTGEGLNEVPALGCDWPDRKERFARLREAVRLIRALWTQDRVTFEGDFYRTESATIYDRPETPVPIYVAGAGPMITKYAGRFGEGFITTSGKARELYSDILMPNLREGLADKGREMADIDRMIEIKLSFDSDLARAKEDTRFWGALALTSEQKAEVEDPLEMEKLADSLTSDQTASRWIVTADPDEVVEKLRPYAALGFNHFVFHAPGPDQARFLRQFSTQVMPKIRAAFG
ncbi:F420-dependent glucose-6-phosphate dehydrogenase [Aquimixticola soesokkakensis]|uniref:F420-dependent glucose-6-phosphate dehydrogenase n=1 Tax=Aquimixticola soesokkakensis TaxID=1519096 RepID=A0A1Y5RTM8_9RHOB|nr:glucose-6-phosphate dehydrogenase (coenzyme-F420) [Aquimixticola soesokkakensis]SLN25215.1 F420-dependent glucose-6-phosphate dehydrogenase [Aquimixticola soesokkakensis]